MCLVRSLPGALAPARALCTKGGIGERRGCNMYVVARYNFHSYVAIELHAALL